MVVSPIKWCHITDSHLGNRQYNLLNRFDDFARAFSKAVDIAFNESPDFILFTGDMFETSRPGAPALRQAIHILSKIKSKGIPLYVIQGNHDTTYSRDKKYGGDILDFLEDMGQFTYIQDECIPVMKNGREIALILGVQYYGKRTSKALMELINNYRAELERTDVPKILMIHAYFEGMKGNVDLRKRQLPRLFDYVAVGHYHMRYEDPELRIYCPGSTEHVSSTEWQCSSGNEFADQKGFYSVTSYYDESQESWMLDTKYLTYKVRPKRQIRTEFGQMDLESIRNKTEKILTENDKADAILKFVFSGFYEGMEHPFVNLQRFRNKIKNAFHADIFSKFTSISTVSRKPQSRREAYEDVLREQFKMPEKEIPSYLTFIEKLIKLTEDKHYNLYEETFDKFVKKLQKS
jgi:DNA repair exonuclease SbcCD nuclease subunit